MIKQRIQLFFIRKRHGQIIIRIDDVCPWMDTQKFQKYLDLLGSYNYKPLLGIIPDCKDPTMKFEFDNDFWNRMLELSRKGYPIAMHGFHHNYSSNKKGLVSRRKKSEFSGFEIKKQLEILCKGKRILESHNIETDIFMAPGHSYDYNTLKALSRIGFKYVTDGRSLQPYVIHGIKCIPAQGSWKLSRKKGILTMCLHPNTETDLQFEELKLFLENNRDNLISFYEAESLPIMPYWFARIEEVVELFMERVVSSAQKTIRELVKK